MSIWALKSTVLGQNRLKYTQSFVNAGQYFEYLGCITFLFSILTFDLRTQQKKKNLTSEVTSFSSAKL